MAEHPNAAAAQTLSPASPGAHCAGCDDGCKAEIDKIEKDTKDIADTPDDKARNQKITDAYNSAYQQDPSNKWMGLAGIVSAQVGCKMNSFPSSMGTSALGDGNKTIFSSIYPYAAYRAKYKSERLKKCYQEMGKEMPPKVKQAFDELDQGHGRAAADLLGEYEQKTVAPPVYDRHPYAFGAAAALPNSSVSIPVSSTCGAPGAVPFQGSILNGDDRFQYYKSLMNQYDR